MARGAHRGWAGAWATWRCARRAMGDASLGAPLNPAERWVGAALAALAVILATRIEKHRRVCHESRRERLLARTTLTLVAGLARLASWVARDSTPFLARVGSVRRELLLGRLPEEVPLVVVGLLYEGPEAAVVHTTCDNFSYQYALAGPDVRFLVSCYWVKFPMHFLWHRALRRTVDPFAAEDRVHWLANSPDELRAALRSGVQVHYVNNNCFVNEDAFTIQPSSQQNRYSAILNANAGRWKRHELARDVPRLAYVTYSRGASGAMEWPVAEFVPAFRNESYLDEADRSAIYGSSWCGLVLSACEGANYSTIEFLLCGLPVVSTPSIGGRDVWLTRENSTICDPTPEAVGIAVRDWIRRGEAGTVDRSAIRAGTLERMEEHRIRFAGALQQVLSGAGIQASAPAILREIRESDRMMHALSFQRSESPHAHPFCQGKAWHRLDALPYGGPKVPVQDGRARIAT